MKSPKKTPEDAVADAQAALDAAEEELRKAKASAYLADKASRIPSKFPPGFRFFWYHRHDPFDSYWQLEFVHDGVELRWDLGDKESSKVDALETAWVMVRNSKAVCSALGILKEGA